MVYLVKWPKATALVRADSKSAARAKMDELGLAEGAEFHVEKPEPHVLEILLNAGRKIYD